MTSTQPTRSAAAGPASGPAGAGQPARPMPDLRYSEAEEDLRAAVRDLFYDRAPWPVVLAGLEEPGPAGTGLWRTLATDLGVAGLLIPESQGGGRAGCGEGGVEESWKGGCEGSGWRRERLHSRFLQWIWSELKLAGLPPYAR